MVHWPVRVFINRVNTTKITLKHIRECCVMKLCNGMPAYIPEEVAQRCAVKKVFLEISQSSQENTCARASFLMKLQASGLKLY